LLAGLAAPPAGAAALLGGAPPAAARAAGPAAALLLPQRPLAAPAGPLWRQLAYPSRRRPPDATLRALCAAVGLGRLLEEGGGPEARADWGARLSGGELARVAFARVLLHRPAIALLDEPAAALPDDEAAAELYALAAAAGVTCVSAGADAPALRGAHRARLRLGAPGAPPGAWRLEALGGE
jgi:putative ATP-binding cassette transporter